MLNVAVEWVALLVHIQEVGGSDLIYKPAILTGLLYWSSIPPSRFQNVTGNYE
jgi:hypothetical protein